MTMPVALPVALPAQPGAAAATSEAPDDVFAAVLAALSGVLGVPNPLAPAPSPAAEPAALTPAGTADAAALPLPSLASSAPGVVDGTSVMTQPPVGIAVAPSPGSATSRPTMPTPGEDVGKTTWHAVTQRAIVETHGAEVRATTPAAEHAPIPGKPAVEEAITTTTEQTSTPVAAETQPAAVPEVVAGNAPVAAVTQSLTTGNRVEAATEARSTRHVQPAVVEAARGLRQEGGGRTSLVVRLDPPELGAVLVRLTVQHGRVDVQLRTPDLAARSDLQAQSYDVQQVLREQGFDLRSFEVGHGDVFSHDQSDAPDRGTPQQRGRADGGPGNTHVTDDAPAPEPSGTWL